jgi:hypothetical protein
MKIRNGFVSNSSSSSFVILGVKQSDFDYEMESKLPEGIEVLYLEDSDCEYVVGSIISDDEYLEESVTTFNDLQKRAKIVADFLNIDISEVKLITGIRPC